MKNKNNIDSINLTSKFKITFLIAIFALILMPTMLTMDIKSAFVIAQNNNRSDSTNTSQSNNQITEVEPNPPSNLTHSGNTDSDGDGILDPDEISIGTNLYNDSDAYNANYGY